MKTRTMWLVVVAGIAVAGFAVFQLVALQRDLQTARAGAAESERLRAEVDALRREREVWRVQAEELRLRRRQAAEVHRLRAELTRRPHESDGGAALGRQEAAEAAGGADALAASQVAASSAMALPEEGRIDGDLLGLPGEFEEWESMEIEVNPERFSTLTNGSSGVIRIWDAASAASLTEYLSSEGLTWVEFSADGTRLITSGREGEVEVLEWPSGPEADKEDDAGPTP